MTKGKIGLVLLSHSEKPLPSTRIAVLNMLPFLHAAGYETQIAFQPQIPVHEPDVAGLADRMARDGVTIAIFQKVHGESVRREIGRLAQLGIKTVYSVCDFVDNDMARACDATLVVTEYLRNLYAPDVRSRVHVVHDGIERPELLKRGYSRRSGGRRAGDRLRAVLVVASALDALPVIGRPPRYVDVTVIGRYPLAHTAFGHLREAYRSLRRPARAGEHRDVMTWLLMRPFRKVNWRLDTVYERMLEADIGIIPVNTDPTPTPGLPVATWQVRSENRLTLKMAAGLPVIASPVPAYLDIIEQGRNGYIASSREEWLACFDELKDPDHREAVGRAARASVLEVCSKEAQAKRLLSVLDALSGHKATPLNAPVPAQTNGRLPLADALRSEGR